MNMLTNIYGKSTGKSQITAANGGLNGFNLLLPLNQETI